MNKYVVRQPIKDKNNNIVAYEIMYEVDKMDIFNQVEDFQAADTISDFFMQNTSMISGNNIVFITFTPNLLFKNMPKVFENDKLVIQIEDNVVIHPLSNNLITKYRKEGYKVAANNFQFNPKYFAIIDSIDYIKIDFKNIEHSSIDNLVSMAKGFNKKCIATGVDSKEIYNYALSKNVDYFQGVYVSEIAKTHMRKTEFIQGNFFRLVVEVTKAEPDLEQIEQIISRDASLSYMILKVVNSPYFALKNRATTIKQALTLLGLVQLKRWVYLLSFKNGDNKEAEEVLKISFLRANFCGELVKYINDFPINLNEAYTMGMFSTLDVLIDAPLSELLDEIYVSDEVKGALLNHEGKCGMLYDLVLSYEKADWNNLKSYADELGIPRNVIAQVYFDCVEEVNNIWNNAFKVLKDK
ncbi:MAG: HDOD domain-containing protein [Clostridia bacterium]|jgi:EAL and modified HD-GYP domain-containing signal transduction protein|nr:HDOD domain-containing protein [Clostridia bacterium]